MAAARTTVRTRVPARPGIRWDRLGRIALLCVLALLVYLYIAPVKAWVETYDEAKVKRAQVAELRAHNEQLRARKEALRRQGTLEREARALGMVRAGERAFVVEDLPK
jgi:cell division protein FtsB